MYNLAALLEQYTGASAERDTIGTVNSRLPHR